MPLTQELLFQQRFEAQKCCVLIPTYNNAKTLKEVLESVLELTSNVIVVNDGSTDTTREILNEFPQIDIINFPYNRGKGEALKMGFKKAEELHYQYAISIDSDGQHFPGDVSVFLEALEKRNIEDPELLVIGSRKMDHIDIPEKSNIGNRYSSFWFWVETGIKLQDTQCGYRLYPIKLVNSLRLSTSKFELEIEVIVKAAWSGAEVKNLPVRVFYAPLDRVTHFKPFKDVTRIVILNIWFVFLKVFYILPKKIFSFQKKKKSIPPKEIRRKNMPPDSNLL